MAQNEVMSMGNSDDSVLMYGYDNNQQMQEGFFSQGVSSSAEDMEYAMMSNGMYNQYDMQNNCQSMF